MRFHVVIDLQDGQLPAMGDCPSCTLSRHHLVAEILVRSRMDVSAEGRGNPQARLRADSRQDRLRLEYRWTTVDSSSTRVVVRR
jgi:hypothetical protein